MQIFLAELLGTFLLILLGNGVTACAILPKSKGENGGWIVITLGWGLAVAFAIFFTGWISGAHINPAVTLAYFVMGKVGFQEMVYYFLGQFSGALIGAYAVFLFYKDHFYSDKDPAYKLLSFATLPAIDSKWRNLFAEALATFVLMIGLFSLDDPRNQIPYAFHAILVGALVVAIGLSLGGVTGYAINPFRDLAPRIVHELVYYPNKSSSEWNYAWVPVVGPFLGAVIAALFYQMVYLKVFIG